MWSPNTPASPESDHTTAGDRHTSTTAELEVEVASGATRHAVVTVLRVRIP